MSNNLMAKRVKIAIDILFVKAKTCKFLLGVFDRIQMFEKQIKTLDQWIQIAESDALSNFLEPRDEMVALRENFKVALKYETKRIHSDSSFIRWILVEFNIRDVTENVRYLTENDTLDALRYKDVRSMLKEIIEMKEKEKA